MLCVLIAIGLYTRFGLRGGLSRDESVYVYAGQRMAHGVAPYKSIFDPKGPFASMLSGLAALVARGTGLNDLYLIRLAFFACSVLTVLGIYLVAHRLWRSTLGAVTAAIVFASFLGFAEDALSGPDAKTPGVLAGVACMWLVARRNWTCAGVAAAIAALTWQPFAPFAIVLLVVAALTRDGARPWSAVLRAFVGCAVPTAATFVYLGIAGAWNDFVQAGVVFPFAGIQRTSETVPQRIGHVFSIVHEYYGVGGSVFLWTGMLAIAVLGAARLASRRTTLRARWTDPLVAIVLITMLAEALYACFDFQGYPDVYPLLPYGALGVGGLIAVVSDAVARGVRVRAVPIALGTAVAVLLGVLTGYSWHTFSDHPDNGRLGTQLSSACAADRILGRHGSMYALGDPVFLALTHQANPDRFIYLMSGVDEWKIKHTPGGLNGWLREIVDDHPAVIGMGGWHDPAVLPQLLADLHAAGYKTRYAGAWHLLLTKPAIARAERLGVSLTKQPTPVATGLAGNPLPSRTCY